MSDLVFSLITSPPRHPPYWPKSNTNGESPLTRGDGKCTHYSCITVATSCPHVEIISKTVTGVPWSSWVNASYCNKGASGHSCIAVFIKWAPVALWHDLCAVLQCNTKAWVPRTQNWQHWPHEFMFSFSHFQKCFLLFLQKARRRK